MEGKIDKATKVRPTTERKESLFLTVILSSPLLITFLKKNMQITKAKGMIMERARENSPINWEVSILEYISDSAADWVSEMLSIPFPLL